MTKAIRFLAVALLVLLPARAQSSATIYKWEGWAKVTSAHAYLVAGKPSYRALLFIDLDPAYPPFPSDCDQGQVSVFLEAGQWTAEMGPVFGSCWMNTAVSNGGVEFTDFSFVPWAGLPGCVPLGACGDGGGGSYWRSLTLRITSALGGTLRGYGFFAVYAYDPRLQPPLPGCPQQQTYDSGIFTFKLKPAR